MALVEVASQPQALPTLPSHIRRGCRRRTRRGRHTRQRCSPNRFFMELVQLTAAAATTPAKLMRNSGFDVKIPSQAVLLRGTAKDAHPMQVGPDVFLQMPQESGDCLRYQARSAIGNRRTVLSSITRGPMTRAPSWSRVSGASYTAPTSATGSIKPCPAGHLTGTCRAWTGETRSDHPNVKSRADGLLPELLSLLVSLVVAGDQSAKSAPSAQLHWHGGSPCTKQACNTLPSRLSQAEETVLPLHR